MDGVVVRPEKRVGLEVAADEAPSPRAPPSLIRDPHAIQDALWLPGFVVYGVHHVQATSHVFLVFDLEEPALDAVQHLGLALFSGLALEDDEGHELALSPSCQFDADLFLPHVLQHPNNV